MRASGRGSSVSCCPTKGRLAVACLALAAGLLTASLAHAQQPKKPSSDGPARSSAQFTLHREEAGGSDAQVARARARAGDCAGALVSFDAALRSTVEPTLRRDRGLCHEQLGHPYPAMEDYRAYLTARPDAPDAEQIRQRLAALEEQTGSSGSGARSLHDEDPEGGHGEVGSARVAIGSGASASVTAKRRTQIDERGRTYDELVEEEKRAEAADASPLRYGTGVVLGPYLQFPRFFFGDRVSTDPAYAAGGTIRYSTGPTLSVIGELGYGGAGTSGAASSLTGPVLMAGVELRFPISRYASDHILLRGGAGFERYVVSGTRAIISTVPGRFAVGYRHVFGPSLGLELLADGGPLLVIPESGDNSVVGVIGASVAFVVGF